MSYYTPMPARKVTQPKTYPVCPLTEVMDVIKKNCGDVYIRERHGKGPNKVIILPEATRELEVMISYGRRSPMNVSEQKYSGFGHFLLHKNGSYITIVKHFIEIQTMNRTAVGASNLGPRGENNPGLDFLAYHREEFLGNEAKFNTDAFGFQVDPFLKRCGPSEFVLEGHTHPDLGVFYSGTDKISGAARAASAPVCIFVCDPVRKQMLGSVGKDFADAEIIVYARRETAQDNCGRDRSLPPPTDEIMRLVSHCLHTLGYAGGTRLKTRHDGKRCLKIKLIIPYKKGATENGTHPQKPGS